MKKLKWKKKRRERKKKKLRRRRKKQKIPSEVKEAMELKKKNHLIV